jgi:hypothetical protein
MASQFPIIQHLGYFAYLDKASFRGGGNNE